MPRTQVVEVSRPDRLAFARYFHGVMNMTESVATAPNLGRMRNRQGRFVPQPQAPSLKQIFKVATSLHQSYSTVPSPLTRAGVREIAVADVPSLQEYQRVLAALNRYNYTITHNIPTRARVHGSTAYRAVTRFRDTLGRTRELIAPFANIPERIETPRPLTQVKAADLMSELLAICKNFNCIWDREAKTIAVVTEDISIISPVVKSLRYDFGKFFIYLPLKKGHFNVKPHTPRYATGTGSGAHERISHPHVLAQKMCYGNGGNAIEVAITQGRLFDVVEIMIGVLRNYGTNPYARLEQWNGVCDVRFNPITNEQVAIDQDVPLPPSAIHHCTACGAEVDQLIAGCYEATCGLHQTCVGCVSRCQYPGCQNFTCEDHEYVCESCERSMCSSHFSDSEVLCDRCC